MFDPGDFTVAGVTPHDGQAAGLEVRCRQCAWFTDTDDDSMSLAEILDRVKAHAASTSDSF